MTSTTLTASDVAITAVAEVVKEIPNAFATICGRITDPRAQAIIASAYVVVYGVMALTLVARVVAPYVADGAQTVADGARTAYDRACDMFAQPTAPAEIIVSAQPVPEDDFA